MRKGARPMRFQYTAAETGPLLRVLRENFELVRIVEPRQCAVCDDQGQPGAESCHQVWGKPERCENCLSMRVVQEKGYLNKLELLNDRAFSVYSKYIEIDDKPRALEMVNEVTSGIQFGEMNMRDVVNQIRRFNRQLITDFLTGVYNRQYLQEHFAATLESAPAGQEYCLAVMDLDHFKSINDRYGHPAGDAVLVQVARQWAQALETLKGAFVARYGGDEFVAVAPSIDYDAFCSLIRRVYEISARRCELPGGGWAHFTVSVGCACRGEGCGSWEALFALADQRMYRRKQAGGDGVECADAPRAAKE